MPWPQTGATHQHACTVRISRQRLKYQSVDWDLEYLDLLNGLEGRTQIQKYINIMSLSDICLSSCAALKFQIFFLSYCQRQLFRMPCIDFHDYYFFLNILFTSFATYHSCFLSSEATTEFNMPSATLRILFSVLLLKIEICFFYEYFFVCRSAKCNMNHLILKRKIWIFVSILMKDVYFLNFQG